MKEYCIYYHKSPENKYYIGQTCQKVEDRWKNNGSGYKIAKMKEAIDKFGWSNFEHGILEEGLSAQEADEREAYYIALFDSVNNGYNVYTANHSGYHFAELWADPNIRAQMIKKLTELRNTPEYHTQQSNRMKEIWMREDYRESQAKTWTDERREQASIRSKRNWENPEYREKISKAQSDIKKETWKDPEYRKKICKQVLCVETNKVFESVKAAAEWCGVKPNTLSTALRSKTHQSGSHPESGIKLHWKYYSDEVRKEG